MKRFRFRLARLERLREIREREARARLGEILRLQRDMQSERDAEQQTLSAREEDHPELAGPVEAATLKQLESEREQTRQRIDAMNHAIDEVEERSRQSAAEHAEAARNHRALEKLHERRQARWNEKAELEERKFLDESFLQRRVANRTREEN